MHGDRNKRSAFDNPVRNFLYSYIATNQSRYNNRTISDTIHLPFHKHVHLSKIKAVILVDLTPSRPFRQRSLQVYPGGAWQINPWPNCIKSISCNPHNVAVFEQNIVLTVPRAQHRARCPMDAQMATKSASLLGTFGAT